MGAIAKALWSWDTSVPGDPVLRCFNRGSATKSGVTAKDLRSFVRVPIVSYGQPSIPVPDSELTQWIRESEDYVEQTTGLLLTPTWVASPPSTGTQSASAQNVQPTSPDGRMRLGIDYDLEDAGYDFKIQNFEDIGWGIQQLRYRPLRNISVVDITAIKSVSFTYPLLNEAFPVPPTWYVEDRDQAFVRLVPSQNIQTLPLYALQLTIGGFADCLPGGIAIHYTAGLTSADYSTRFAFVRRLVALHAGITALASVQGTVNLGVEKSSVLTDGVQTGLEYNKAGPYGPLIAQYQLMVDDLIGKVRDLVGGPALVTI